MAIREVYLTWGIFIVCNVKFTFLLYSTDKNFPYGVIPNCFHALRSSFGNVICLYMYVMKYICM